LALIVGVVKEVAPGERRVAMVPAVMDTLTKLGCEVRVEAGAGEAAGFRDADYVARGARLLGTRAEVFAESELVLAVQVAGDELSRPGQILIGMADVLNTPQRCAPIADRGSSLFSMELIPRITRAQSMDVLSSMATVAGYKAVLLAAEALPRMFPLLMTAAGTVPPARVLVMGAGVAGLQAIATARRLGAVVSGYDVRAAVREQIESLGAKFVELKIHGSAEGQGGYAKALDASDEEELRRQLIPVLREQDVVITTAAIPGRKAPLLITAEMAKELRPGGVIVDLAAERGGNCELTRANEVVRAGDITILGPVNLASTVPAHASVMYARNLATFLKHLAPKGEVVLDFDDEITRETLVTHQGSVVHPRVASMLGQSTPSGALPFPGPAAASPQNKAST
jgi:H+-translocating NAD(P) transhydrogenase subunit alpha